MIGRRNKSCLDNRDQVTYTTMEEVIAALKELYFSSDNEKKVKASEWLEKFQGTVCIQC